MNRHTDKNDLNILVLEPYFGGSHESFLNGLSKHLPFKFEFMTFPARKWKWRMRIAAPFYARKLHDSGKRYDRILCSTFVDVATFKGLAPSWVREIPLITYFHENQFNYPIQVEDKRDFHFVLTNLTTALASDSLAFNSEYNLNSFIEGTEKLLRKSYDLKLNNPRESILNKSQVLPPGIDFSDIDVSKASKQRDIPVVVWNHRWEHDKNPSLFFKALFKLDREGIDFKLIVLGESFRDCPSIFDEAKTRLSNRILHFGYASSHQDYARFLKQGSLVISTATHEFFGISVIEAVRAGCRPLLPKRLSYPELFPEKFLFEDKEFFKSLKNTLAKNRLSADESIKLTERFSWNSLAPLYKAWIIEAGES